MTGLAGGAPEPAAGPTGDEGFMRHTAVMSAGTALSRATGFLRLFVAAAVLGQGLLADTYNRANTTPNIVYELVLGGILTSVFIPVFVEWLQSQGQDEAFELARRVLTLALSALIGVALLGIVFAGPIIRLFMVDAPTSNRAEQIALGVFFLRWFMPQVVFYGVGAVATGLLNTHRRFAIGMFAPVLNNVVAMLTLGLYGWMRHGAPASIDAITSSQKLVLALGTTLGVVAMTVALWPSLRAIGFRWRWRWDVRHPAVRRLGKLALWVVVYVAANQAAYLVIIILGSGLGDGKFTTYQYAFVLFQLPYAIFGVSIFTALVPGMSGLWVAGDREGVKQLLSKGIRTTALVLLPAAAGYLALAVPIAIVLLHHGQTTFAEATLDGRTLQAFSLGLVFFALFQLLSRTFYAMQDTRTPALINILAAAVNIGADLLFTKRFGWGVQGLALGHATSYIFSTAACLIILHHRLSGLDGGRIGRTLTRVVPLAALTGGIAWAVTRVLAHALGETTTILRLVSLAGGVVSGLLVFLGG
ncbi:MAG: putative peptidoglycan lipid flippase, partial [Actinomycetota bacterium]|nr:putative peptidoglycan lipid flippase [Actinomycetota bacterium]